MDFSETAICTLQTQRPHKESFLKYETIKKKNRIVIPFKCSVPLSSVSQEAYFFCCQDLIVTCLAKNLQHGELQVVAWKSTAVDQAPLVQSYEPLLIKGPHAPRKTTERWNRSSLASQHTVVCAHGSARGWKTNAGQLSE